MLFKNRNIEVTLILFNLSFKIHFFINKNSTNEIFIEKNVNLTWLNFNNNSNYEHTFIFIVERINKLEYFAYIYLNINEEISEKIELSKFSVELISNNKISQLSLGYAK